MSIRSQVDDICEEHFADLLLGLESVLHIYNLPPAFETQLVCYLAPLCSLPEWIGQHIFPTLTFHLTNSRQYNRTCPVVIDSLLTPTGTGGGEITHIHLPNRRSEAQGRLVQHFLLLVAGAEEPARPWLVALARSA